MTPQVDIDWDQDGDWEVREVGKDERNPMIVELFSPPRVTKVADTREWTHGACMDKLAGWDFNKEGDRREAIDYIRRERPLWVIGCPPCTMFSQLQNLYTWGAGQWGRYERDRGLLEFAATVYKEQIKGGRYFIH